MIGNQNKILSNKYYLPYNYGYLFFAIFSILFIAFLGYCNQLEFTFIPVIAMGIDLFYNLKSIAKIDLNGTSLRVIYRPFYKPLLYEYTLNEMEQVSVYYSNKRYHSTMLFIKLINKSDTIKHTTAMSIAKSKKLIEVFRSLNIKVIELEWPKVDGEVVTLP